ncbi:MAG: hypothetical protein A2845_02175 [Candidatus Lloydbacteria bacterium RIFCSPHIGHO2_01_FULL_49_22]|uniref:Uncharacterized protein n=1 Tax=Candidatus Lloydbacteria bacterium RIFCSPHIGHO2_01_FULL_49_22 TaxID=1798658 RepID=A0A1G2CV24_9BACT|nr:MAG: hypothetical protein A2845_02175 [Candidatus Lloydbacteria bacterium RIFCSPHIGHO2_01_FULL_49_22]OGZ10259.1 MAG: hypothetical protein A3C14_01875 [Candidatus Lloydbacteria bacterium RIFCSPHIGHO2_02_FULL_50_18]
MFKEFLMKKLIASKLGNMPKEQQEKIIGLVTKNPKLFEEIALKIKKKTDAGANQMMATTTVMKEYAPQIQKLMAGSD